MHLLAEAQGRRVLARSGCSVRRTVTSSTRAVYRDGDSCTETAAKGKARSLLSARTRQGGRPRFRPLKSPLRRRPPIGNARRSENSLVVRSRRRDDTQRGMRVCRACACELRVYVLYDKPAIIQRRLAEEARNSSGKCSTVTQNERVVVARIGMSGWMGR